jgi:PmbA protein
MDFERVKSILISEAKKRELCDYEIYFTREEQLSAETLGDEISAFSSGVGAGVSFRCIVDGRMGNAATELFTQEEIASLVSRAMSNALFIENDDPVVIYGGSEHYESTNMPSIDVPTSAFIKNEALALQRKTYALSEFVGDGTQSCVFGGQTDYKLVNSRGLELSNTVRLGGAYVQAVVKKDGEAQADYHLALGLDKESMDKLPQRALDKAIARLGASEVTSGKYKIIIEGSQMRSLLATFSSIFSGKSALLGLSLLAGKEGEKIASDCVTIVDDPLMEGSYVQTSFDGEGVATSRKNVVENGVLKTLLYDLSTAAKAGVSTTANGQRASYATQVSIAPFTFYIKGGSNDEEQLLAKMDNGIYVTELKGLHAGADAVTGDFSIESSGFLVENGRKTRAVKGFTVAGNFFDVLKNVQCVASEVKFGMSSGFTVFGSPDVLLGEMSVAGE